MSAPSWWHRDLLPGDEGEDVITAQVLLGMPPTGVLDRETEAIVRGYQHAHHLPPTGEIDTVTAKKLGERATKGLVPEWFTRDIALWEIGPDVARVNVLLGVPAEGDVLTPEAEAGVRRLQSANGLTPTGVVDVATAKILGD